MILKQANTKREKLWNFEIQDQLKQSVKITIRLN